MSANVVSATWTPWVECSTDFKSEWARLASSLNCNPTLGPHWFSVIAAALAPARTPLTVLSCRNPSGELSLVLPHFKNLRWMYGVRLAVLQPGSNLMSYHAEIVANAALAGALDELLANCGPWDVLHFGNVALDSKTAEAIQSLATRAGSLLQVVEGDESPYLTLQGTWSAYLASRSKKFRYKLRQRREAIMSDREWQLRWFASSADKDYLLADMLQIEKKSWKEDAGRSIGSRAAELQYHQGLIEFLSESGSLVANVLYRSARPVAYCLSCHVGDWFGHLKTSFDREFASYSPGTFVIDASIERAFDLKAQEFDFLGGADPHKLAWTSTTRKHADFFLFGRTMKGRLVAGIKAIKNRLLR